MTANALPERTPVLVIGGGPVGLVVSLLLSKRGISHVVIERRRDFQRAPAAHVLRRRPMEILDEVGVADEVRRSAPELALDFIIWCTTLGGTEIGRLDLRPRDPQTGERAPDCWTNCPQNVLEPILMRAAERQPKAHILRGAECVDIEQTDDVAHVRIRSHDGFERRIEADWVIAADGAGSSARHMLGVAMEGPGPLVRFAMVHLEADLTPWIQDRSGPLFWMMNPESMGTLIVHDPRKSHVFMAPLQGGADELDGIPDRLAGAFAIPLTPKIISIDTWSPHVQVAERYCEGRVFLVGDAAHRFPPTGGLGLNTGIQEAHVLVERLSAVLTGEGGRRLMDGYEAACRPAARSNADESFENMKRLGEIARVIGPCPDLASLERRITSLGSVEQRQLEKAVEAQRSHFLSDGTQPAGLQARGA